MDFSVMRGKQYIDYAQADRKATEIRLIDQKIKDLQRKIQEASENNKLDAEAKQKLIADYREQIQRLESEKLQKQMEFRETQADTSNKNTDAAAPQAEMDEFLDTATQKALVQTASSGEITRALGRARVSAENELRISSSNSYINHGDITARPSLQKLASIQGRELKEADKANQAFREAGEPEEEQKATGGTGFREPGQYLNLDA